MVFDPKVIKEIAKDIKIQDDVFGPEGIIKQLTKHWLEAALAGELTPHLGYDKHGKAPSEDARNGYSTKEVQSEHGPMSLDVPRDRASSFEPVLVPKRQSRIAGLNDKVIALYARGLSTRDIQAQLQEMYGVEISAGLITSVTDTVMEEVKAWQCRPLDRVYPILYLDCLFVKVQENKQVINKAIYLALGVNAEGQKELLGLWLCQQEGAKFWLSVLTELKNRGVEQVFRRASKTRVLTFIVRLPPNKANLYFYSQHYAYITDIPTNLCLPGVNI